MAKVIPIIPKNYAFCSECDARAFFIILDDDGNLTETECTTCNSQSEFELEFFDVECVFEPDN